MCGLPSSGKSTHAQKLSRKYDAIILSSDEIREELFNNKNDQSNNAKVFEVMNGRTKQLLQKGENVIYDSTGINRRRRIHLINHELMMANEKIVYYMNTHINDCINNDRIRERTVGIDVIMKMYRNMHIPIKGEGWGQVNMITPDIPYNVCISKDRLESILYNNDSYEQVMGNLVTSIEGFDEIHELPHDSKYHSFSVSRHTYYVYDFVRQYTDDLRLLWAALFHDIGKGCCKSFINYKGEKTRYASFIGHELVSGQIALHALIELGYNIDFALGVAYLCQFHMHPMKAGDKKMKEVKELLGNDLYEDLMILHFADKRAK